MEDKIKFPANVILIDVAFLNEVVYGAKNFLEGKLGRKKCCWCILLQRTC